MIYQIKFFPRKKQKEKKFLKRINKVRNLALKDLRLQNDKVTVTKLKGIIQLYKFREKFNH